MKTYYYLIIDGEGIALPKRMHLEIDNGQVTVCSKIHMNKRTTLPRIYSDEYTDNEIIADYATEIMARFSIGMTPAKLEIQ